MNPAARQKLTIARSQLLLTQPFFGVLALRLKLVENNAIPTLAVDGKTIFYNEGFITRLSNSLTKSAMAHEVMHCVLDHISRRQGREPKRWNHAGDYALNQILKDSGFEIGQGWLLDPQYKGMTADQIYDKLPKDPEGDALDDIMPGTGDPGDGVDWKVATVQAAAEAAKQGNLPGSLKRFVDEITAPQINWRDQLRQFITQISKDDYSWTRPNKRYLGMGFYMPSLYSESMGDIVVAVDTSGSIDEETLNTFAAEVKAIVASVRPSTTHVVYCDAEVNHVDTFSPNDELTFEMHGGGNTCFTPVAEYISDNLLRPECVVYLTDGYGGYPEPQEQPWLWCMTSDVVAPFGETIKIKT